MIDERGSYRGCVYQENTTNLVFKLIEESASVDRIHVHTQRPLSVIKEYLEDPEQNREEFQRIVHNLPVRVTISGTASNIWQSFMPSLLLY